MQRHPSQDEAERIGRALSPPIFDESGGLAGRAIVSATLGDHALPVDSDDDDHPPFVRAIFGEDQRHDLPAEWVEAAALRNLDEEVELLPRAIPRKRAADEVELMRPELGRAVQGACRHHDRLI